MASEDFKPDGNFKAGGVVGGYSSADAIGAANPTRIALRLDPTTGRLLVDVSGIITDIEDGAGDSIMDAANNAIQVSIVNDGVGIGGGTQYAEDAAHQTGDTGTLALVVRKDTAAQLATTDGDYTALITDANGRLHVLDQNSAALLTAAQAIQTAVEGTVAVSNAGLTELAAAINTNQLDVNIATDSVGIGGGTQYAVDAALGATPTGTLGLAIRDDALSALTPVEGDAIGLRVDANGALWVIPSGTVTVANGGTFATQATLQTGSNTVGEVTIGAATTAAGDLAKAEDAAHSSGDVGVMGLAVRSDTAAALATTTGDYIPLITDASGRLWVNPQGNVAADAADSGNPLKIGGKSTDHTAAPTEMSATGDRVDALFDRVGRQAVYQGYVLKSAVINASTSGDNTIVAAVAGKLIRVLAVLIVSDGTTDVRWESGASGTAKTGQVPLQAREGYSISNPWGLFETASNTLLNLELTAAVNVHGFVTYIEVDD